MTQIAIVLIASALAGFVHGATGFGSALVAMPILTLFLGVATAAPLLALVGQLVTAAVLYQNWHALHFREALRLIVASTLGIPVGLILLRYGNETVITGILGVVLIGYALYALAIEPRLATSGRSAAACEEAWWLRFVSLGTGFIAGVLGGAYNTNGPPVIVYGSIRRWPKEQFKSVLQSMFIVNGVFIVAGHAGAGLITKEVLYYCLYGVPASLAGMVFGFLLDRRLNAAYFRKIVLALILILGIVLLV